MLDICYECLFQWCAQYVWVWQVAPCQKTEAGPPCCEHLPAASLEVLWTEAWHALEVEKQNLMGWGCAVKRRGVQDFRFDTEPS